MVLDEQYPDRVRAACRLWRTCNCPAPPSDTVYVSNVGLRGSAVAERIVRILVDDLDGQELPEGAGESIEFGVRGVTYRIDLSASNATKLDKAFKPFVEAATKLRTTARKGSTRTVLSGAAAGRRPKEQLEAIRGWARQQGHKVSNRGRIRDDIIEAFDAAH